MSTEKLQVRSNSQYSIAKHHDHHPNPHTHLLPSWKSNLFWKYSPQQVQRISWAVTQMFANLGFPLESQRKGGGVTSMIMVSACPLCPALLTTIAPSPTGDYLLKANWSPLNHQAQLLYSLSRHLGNICFSKGLLQKGFQPSMADPSGPPLCTRAPFSVGWTGTAGLGRGAWGRCRCIWEAKAMSGLISTSSLNPIRPGCLACSNLPKFCLTQSDFLIQDFISLFTLATCRPPKYLRKFSTHQNSKNGHSSYVSPQDCWTTSNKKIWLKLIS